MNTKVRTVLEWIATFLLKCVFGAIILPLLGLAWVIAVIVLTIYDLFRLPLVKKIVDTVVYAFLNFPKKPIRLVAFHSRKGGKVTNERFTPTWFIIAVCCLFAPVITVIVILVFAIDFFVSRKEKKNHTEVMKY